MLTPLHILLGEQRFDTTAKFYLDVDVRIMNEITSYESITAGYLLHSRAFVLS